MADPASADQSSSAAPAGDKRPGGDRRFGGKGGRPRKTEKKTDKEVWIPATKLGRLVQAGYISNLETIYHFSLPVKEYQIIDHFVKDLKDEVLKIMPVQKQTPSGQRTRFKAFVVVGDRRGHVGLGVKCSKEVATSIRGGIIQAKISLVAVRLGYWGNKIGAPHTVPTKVTGKCGSVSVRLVPAPRGTGIVAAGVPTKLLQFAGVDDVYSKTTGHTKTMGNFAKATFYAIKETYQYLTPDLWKPAPFQLDPFIEFSRELEQLSEVKIVQKEEKKPFEKEGGGRFGDREGGGRFGDREGGRGGFGGRGRFGDREGGRGGYGGRGFGGRGGYGGRGGQEQEGH